MTINRLPFISIPAGEAFNFVFTIGVWASFFCGRAAQKITTVPEKNCSSNLTKYNELKLFTL